MTLENRGYQKIAHHDPWAKFSFHIDPLNDDLLIFSPDSKDDLTGFALVHDGSLLLQVLLLCSMLIKSLSLFLKTSKSSKADCSGVESCNVFGTSYNIF